MKISLHTLGCPGWDLDTVIARAQEYGFDGIEFRGLGSSLDITTMLEFTSGIDETCRKLTAAGLQVGGVATSITVCDPGRIEANLAEARRSIPVARKLGCRNLRVFGGGNLETTPRAELAAIGRRTIEQILALPGAGEMRWLFETHDNWVSAADCRLLLDHIDSPAFGALWDVGHTSRVGGEQPAESYAALGGRIHAVHVKDAAYDPQHPLAMKDGWRYVPPGAGQLPLAEAIALLRRKGYDGWVIFEHEKRWHPELPEPEEAFPQFIEWVRPLLA